MMADGKKCVRAHLVAKGSQDPDLQEGLVDAPGRVSLRSPHLQVISRSAIRKWKLRILDIKNAFLQSDGFDRDVFLHAPAEWDKSRMERAWNSKAPAYGVNDAPAAVRRSLERYILNSGLSMKCVGRRCQATTFDSCLFFVFRGEGHAVGAFAAHIDDILGRGEPGVLAKIRNFSERRFGGLKLQESSFVHVGVELVLDSTFSATLIQGDFPEKSQPRRHVA